MDTTTNYTSRSKEGNKTILLLLIHPAYTGSHESNGDPIIHYHLHSPKN